MKGCGQNVPGLPVVENFQRQVSKSMCGATSGSPAKRELGGASSAVSPAGHHKLRQFFAVLTLSDAARHFHLQNVFFVVSILCVSPNKTTAQVTDPNTFLVFVLQSDGE